MTRRSQAAGEVALVTLIALSVAALAALAVAAAQILGGGKPVVAWTAEPDACAEIVGGGGCECG